MTAELSLWNTKQLRRQIADKQYQQAQRRAHLADLQAIIDRHDLEIGNLQTQLDRGVIACRPSPSADAASHAQSVDAASSNTKPAPSSPPTPTKQEQHAR